MSKHGFPKVSGAYLDQMKRDMQGMSTAGSDEWHFITHSDPRNNTFYTKPAGNSLAAFDERRVFRSWTGLKAVCWRGDDRAPREDRQMLAHGFHPQYVQGGEFDPMKNRYPSQAAASSFTGPAMIWRDSADKKDVLNETTVCIARDIRGTFFFPLNQSTSIYLYAVVATEGVNTYYVQKQDDHRTRSSAQAHPGAERAWETYQRVEAKYAAKPLSREQFMAARFGVKPFDPSRQGRALNRVWQFKERCVNAVQPEDIVAVWKVERQLRGTSPLDGIRFRISDGGTINGRCQYFDRDDSYVNYVFRVTDQYKTWYPRDSTTYLKYEGLVNAAGQVIKPLVVESGRLSDRGTD